MNINFPKIEKRILKFWQKNEIFEKSIKQRKKAPNFVFYEGPPTANAKPGIHHVLSRAFKDIICRYKTMRGFKVERKAGWDTHGLPVELQIEKKLGLKSKKEIKKYGIAQFNKKCKESVWQYKKDWEKLSERIGFWLDMKNPYITYDSNYIETVWWIIKKIWEKKLLNQNYKVSPYCPRCQTILSSHEVAQGYKKVKDLSIYIKFPILNSEFKNTSFLVWTTTPWTLPGNVVIALNPKFNYLKIKIGEEYLILAKELVKILDGQYEIIKEFKGENLIGLKYQPLYLINEEILNNAYKTISADFVSLKEGTGLVHIAPSFGEEDMDLIKAQNLKLKIKGEQEIPILLTVDEEGKIKPEVKKWEGLFVKDADPLIVEDLENRRLIFKKELYEHDYPFCWRCHSPLLYYAKKSWFINMQKVKKDLIKNNQKINWSPSHLKNGRFGEWLKEVKDWALSRERYWGTPLPIWKCEKCETLEAVGSLEDLLKQKFSTNNYYLLRHGHSLRQVKKIASCWPEKIPLPLTEKGEKETKEAAEKLKEKKIDLIFSSDLLRTKQTAKIISSETGAKIIFDKRLREWNIGIFNGKNPELTWEYLKEKGEVGLIKLPKGESLRDIRKRMYSFIKAINKKYQNKNILIISHEMPLTILEGTLKAWPLGKILETRESQEKNVIQVSEWREVKFRNLPYNTKTELDFHLPYIDNVEFSCFNCWGKMKRESEVIDCWFDSGSMPFAQYHYPFENKDLIDKKIQFPADYISEGIDQTRGWFYTLLAVSTLLGKNLSYKNVISLGHVLDEKGEKMSKSKGNVVDPWYVIEKYGADIVRWYFYTINHPGDSKLFSTKEIEESLRKFTMILWNSYLFWETYRIKIKNKNKVFYSSQNILDKWIISKLNQLILDITNNLETFNISLAARSIENFIINNLSLWYIRRSRKRFQNPEKEKEINEASQTLGFVILTLSKLIAPFIPFFSEEVYQKISKNYFENFKQSIHLEDWPKVNKKLINKKLEKNMEKAREIVALVLAERAQAKIKVRQPLNELKIKNYELKKEKELLDLIKEEVNVKEIIFDSKNKKEVELDIKITLELKEEGIMREIIRHLQEMRKQAGLKPKDKILIYCFGDAYFGKILEKNKESFLTETRTKNFYFQKISNLITEKEVEIDEKKFWLGIK